MRRKRFKIISFRKKKVKNNWKNVGNKKLTEKFKRNLNQEILI